MSIHGIRFVVGALFIALLAIALFAPIQSIRAQSSENKAPEQELVQTEIGFFEAWKARDLAYFRTHMPENGVFWNDSGTFSRDEQLDKQPTSAKNCVVDGYSLSDFGVLPLGPGVYLLTYKAEQYATCSGEKVPVHVNGSSVYGFKQGHWQAIYRAQVPLRNQG